MHDGVRILRHLCISVSTYPSRPRVPGTGVGLILHHRPDLSASSFVPRARMVSLSERASDSGLVLGSVNMVWICSCGSAQA